jgi:hypothetical protein
MRVSGRSKQFPRCGNREAGMVITAKAWDEQSDKLVSNELVHDPVVPHHDGTRNREEPVEQLAERRRRHRLRDRRGASDVGEQH